MNRLWNCGIIVTVILVLNALVSESGFNIDEERCVNTSIPEDLVNIYEVERDTLTNTKYAYGEDNLFGSNYPQCDYNPYLEICGEPVFDENSRSSANQKCDWSDTSKYPTVVYNNSEQEEYKHEYLHTDINGNREYPPFDEDATITPDDPAPCCYQFNANALPNRPHFPRFGNNSIPRGRRRKEYRQLTFNQRTSFHKAVNALKDSGVWDIIADLHRHSSAPYAHDGASFLPWHREYLFRLENALARAGYTGPGLPYFDSTLDYSLPNPAESAVWTAAYLGNNDGTVNIGPFANWTVTSSCTFVDNTLYRNAIYGPFGQCFLYSDFDIRYVFNKRCFRDLTCNSDCKFELDHGTVHIFLGGHMSYITCAPNDPFFFLHHAFVDCVWEEFRQDYQKSNIRVEYPSRLNGDDVGSIFQPPWSKNGFEWNAPMHPFNGLLNGHGMDTWYERYYKCLPRPVKCESDDDCGSDLLWCDFAYYGRCKGKVKLGGDCTDLPDQACSGLECGSPSVNGTCNANICECP